MFSVFTPSNAKIRQELRRINYHSYSDSQQENFQLICYNNKKNLFDILTGREDNTDALINELRVEFLLIALQELPPAKRLTALSSFKDCELDSVYRYEYQGLDNLEKYKVRRTVLHTTAIENHTKFTSILTLLPNIADKLNALMLRDNHGQTVFYILCAQNKDLAFTLLQDFTLENQQKLLTQRSLKNTEFVDDPSIIDNQRFWYSDEQFPLYFYINSPDHLSVLLNCFSTEAFCDFLGGYSFQPVRLLESAIQNPRSLLLMLEKLGSPHCKQLFKKESGGSMLQYVNHPAVFDVLDSFFAREEICGFLLQGEDCDYKNEHPLFRQCNEIDRLQRLVNSEGYEEKKQLHKQLLQRMLSYFEHDEQRMELIAKQSFYGYTLLYHTAVLSDVLLCHTLLEWVPKQHLLHLLIDDVSFHCFLEGVIRNHKQATLIKEHISFGLMLANNPESLAYLFHLLSTEDQFVFLQHLLMKPDLAFFLNENEQACLVILKEQVIILCGLAEARQRDAITSTLLGWIPASIIGPKISKQQSDYQAILNTTSISSLQTTCLERSMFVGNSMLGNSIHSSR